MKSTKVLSPGRSEVLELTVDAAKGGRDDTYYAKVIVDPGKPLFHECREDNNRSADTRPACPK